MQLQKLIFWILHTFLDTIIEIHHTKPIFQYEDSDMENTLKNTVKNLATVCSNCHRMIHRNWSKPLEIQYLINEIDAHGSFKR